MEGTDLSPTSQRCSWVIDSKLLEENLVSELFLRLSTKCVSTKMLFHERLFNEMLSTKCRKTTMGKKQGILGYSFFLWGVIAQQQLLDIPAD